MNKDGCQLARLNLSEEEASYLDDILTIWIDGYHDAREETLRDPLINTFEDLINVNGGIAEQEIMAAQIRSRLREVTNERGT